MELPLQRVLNVIEWRFNVAARAFLLKLFVISQCAGEDSIADIVTLKQDS